MQPRPLLVLCAVALSFTACKVGGGLQIRGLPSSLTSGGSPNNQAAASSSSAQGASSSAQQASASGSSSRGSSSSANKGEAAPSSKLASLDPHALVELAIQDMMGVGYGVEVSQPDPTEKPVEKPKLALSHDDQLHLLNTVWRPFINDKDNARALQKAACEYDLRRTGKKWDKTIGEALDARACSADVSNNDVYRHPQVQLAAAQILLANHPKKDELLGAVALHVAQSQGGNFRQVCYRTEQRPEPTPAVGKGCTEFWTGTWNGYGNVPSLGTYFVEPIPPEKMRLAELKEAAFYAEKIPANSTAYAKGQELLKTIKKLEKPRQAKREATIKKMRARPSKFISQKEVEAEFPTSYLWHEVCGTPVDDGRWEGNAFVRSKMLCVKVATEGRRGCELREFTFRKVSGGKEWFHYSTAMGADDLECP